MAVSAVARRYAATLLAAAAEKDLLAAVQQDVEGIQATLGRSAELASFLADRLLGAQVQSRVLEALFAGRVQELTLNFLHLLVQRRRLYLLPAVLAAFSQALEEQAGIVTARGRTAVALSDDQVERLRRRLAAYMGKEVRLQLEVDPDLRSGLVVQIGDAVFDGTLATHLDRLRRQLIGG